jgi:hypothetical protein
VTLFWKTLFSLIAALLLYWGMVTAFHLLNLPSNLSVVEGLALLFFLAAAAWLVFRNLWRRV